MGLPCVVTDVRGCRQVVTDGRNGLLVPAKDSRALAQAILSLLGDPAKIRQYGAGARERALAEFDERRVFAIVAFEYQRLLSEKGIGSPAFVAGAPIAESGEVLQYARGQ